MSSRSHAAPCADAHAPCVCHAHHPCTCTNAHAPVPMQLLSRTWPLRSRTSSRPAAAAAAAASPSRRLRRRCAAARAPPPSPTESLGSCLGSPPRSPAWLPAQLAATWPPPPCMRVCILTVWDPSRPTPPHTSLICLLTRQQPPCGAVPRLALRMRSTVALRPADKPLHAIHACVHPACMRARAWRERHAAGGAARTRPTWLANATPPAGDPDTQASFQCDHAPSHQPTSSWITGSGQPAGTKHDYKPGCALGAMLQSLFSEIRSDTHSIL